jgi:two-component system OmpR family sensor kinase
VRAYTELLALGAARDPADFERAMVGLEQASERMSALVEELFLLAHLDEGRPLASDPVDLEQVVTQALDVARALEPERPFTVDTETAVVVGDEGRLRQLVDNLLANVRTHTPSGTTAVITVTGHDGTVSIEVADDGPGVPAGELPRIFDRFYRAESPVRRPGSGLGLAIVSGIAAAHGGMVRAAASHPHGLRVTLTLPASAVRAGAGATAAGP